MNDGSAKAIDLGAILTDNTPGQVITQPLRHKAAIDITNEDLSIAGTSSSEYNYLGSSSFRGVRFFGRINTGYQANTNFFLYLHPAQGLKLSTRNDRKNQVDT